MKCPKCEKDFTQEELDGYELEELLGPEFRSSHRGGLTKKGIYAFGLFVIIFLVCFMFGSMLGSYGGSGIIASLADFGGSLLIVLGAAFGIALSAMYFLTSRNKLFQKFLQERAQKK
ncbi:MAG: hypothetical protein ABIF89_00205 [bacterium]